MKNTITLLFIILTIGCKSDIIQDDSFDKEKQLEEYVIEQAMGADNLNYRNPQLKKVTDVTYAQQLENFKKLVQTDEMEIDTILKNISQSIEDARASNNVDFFNFFSFYQKHLANYKKIENKDSIAYSVYQHKYQITKELMGVDEVNVVNYPFFDVRDSLLFVIDEISYDEAESSYVQTETTFFDILYKENQ